MPEPPGTSVGAGGDGVDQGEDVALAIFWESEDFLDSVNLPANDDLLLAPGGVAFAELLEGYLFLPCSVVFVVRLEDVVNGAKEVSRHLPSFCWPSLDYTNEVIEVYFDVGYGCVPRVQGQGLPVDVGF